MSVGTYVVNEKFRYFVTYLHQNCINNKRDAVNILRKIYVIFKSSLIDCELIVHDLNNIVYNAFHEKNKLKIRLRMFPFFLSTSIEQFKLYDKRTRCFFSNKLIKLLI